MTRDSNSVAQTEAIAATLAATLRPGDCIALHGDLGAGKTQFVRGLIRALGGNSRSVSSPTYMLLNIYQTPVMTVYHLDAYRVTGPEDFAAIGFTELLDQGGIVAIEWPERVDELLPIKRIDVRIETLSPRRRRIGIEGMERE